MSGLCSVREWLELLSVYQGCTRVCCLTSLSPVPRAGQEGTWLMRSLNVNTIQQNWHCSTASPRVSPCSCAPASQTEEGTLVHHSLLSMPAHTNAHTHHLVLITVNTHTPAAHTTHREGVQEGRARVCTLCSQENPLQQLHVLHTLIGLTAVITCQLESPQRTPHADHYQASSCHNNYCHHHLGMPGRCHMRGMLSRGRYLPQVMWGHFLLELNLMVHMATSLLVSAHTCMHARTHTHTSTQQVHVPMLLTCSISSSPVAGTSSCMLYQM